MSKVSPVRGYPFLIIPSVAMTKEFAPIVKGAPLAVLCALSARANNESQCWPSLDDLAQRTGYSKTTVIKAKETLVAHGIISVESRKGTPDGGSSGGSDTDLYTLLPPEGWSSKKLDFESPIFESSNFEISNSGPKLDTEEKLEPEEKLEDTSGEEDAEGGSDDGPPLSPDSHESSDTPPVGPPLEEEKESSLWAMVVAMTSDDENEYAINAWQEQRLSNPKNGVAPRQKVFMKVLHELCPKIQSLRGLKLKDHQEEARNLYGFMAWIQGQIEESIMNIGGFYPKPWVGYMKRNKTDGDVTVLDIISGRWRRWMEEGE